MRDTNRSRQAARLGLAVAIGLALGVQTSAAEAGTQTVSSCADDGSAGTLRTAIGNSGSGDIIDLSGLPALDPSCTDSTITLTAGQISVAHNVTLQGPSDVTLTIAAGTEDRVLYSTSKDMPNAYLAIKSLTISNGSIGGSNAQGGCIGATYEVQLDHATVTNCTAYSAGGGKYPVAAGGAISAGSVTMTNASSVTNNIAKGSGISVHVFGGGILTSQFTCTDSTVSGNKSIGSGGGVLASGNVSLTRCTIDSNGAKYGGGILAEGSGVQVTIDESTISGNLGGKGGGINSKSPLTITNSTIAFNNSGQSYGAGIYSSANVSSISSIIARNIDTSGLNADVMLATGKTLSGSNNLVMSINNIPLVGVIVSSADPMLASLGGHGGATRTLALLPGSPAIDAGKNTKASATDQRGSGFAREVPTGDPDIGAYERQVHDDEVFYGGFE